VAEIDRALRPRDEVVHLAGGSQVLPAIEAASFLNLQHSGQAESPLLFWRERLFHLRSPAFFGERGSMLQVSTPFDPDIVIAVAAVVAGAAAVVSIVVSLFALKRSGDAVKQAEKANELHEQANRISDNALGASRKANELANEAKLMARWSGVYHIKPEVLETAGNHSQFTQNAYAAAKALRLTADFWVNETIPRDVIHRRYWSGFRDAFLGLQATKQVLPDTKSMRGCDLLKKDDAVREAFRQMAEAAGEEHLIPTEQGEVNGEPGTDSRPDRADDIQPDEVSP
jgi:hypothetical protein